MKKISYKGYRFSPEIIQQELKECKMKVRKIIISIVAATVLAASSEPSSAQWYGYGYDPAPAIFAGAGLALFTGIRAAQVAQQYGYPYAYGYPYPYGYLPCWHQPIFGYAATYSDGRVDSSGPNSWQDAQIHSGSDKLVGAMDQRTTSGPKGIF
jgi:hypothetical protein